MDYSNQTYVAPRVRISVRQEDIDLAKPNCPGKCAVALAVERQRNATYVRMGLTADGDLSWTENGMRFRFPKVPQKVVMVTYQVDNGLRERVKPFSFELHEGFVKPAGLNRPRYAGGKRHGKRKNRRKDKGEAASRTLRREKLRSLLAAIK